MLNHEIFTDLTPQSNEIPQALAVTALGEVTQEPPLQSIKLGEDIFETNIPIDAKVVVASDIIGQEPFLVPGSLDTLPVGDYFLATDRQDIGEKTIRQNKDIHIINGPKGKAVTVDSFTFKGRLNFDPSVKKLAAELGFTYGEYGVLSIPTPETLVCAAADFGIAVELVNSESPQLPGDVYLDIFKQGKYPVSVSEEYWYIHDAEDDHLFAVVLGGTVLRDSLSQAADAALSSGSKEHIDEVASNLDNFTSNLRSHVIGITIGPPMSEEKIKASLYRSGAKIGLGAESVDEIYSEIVTNARKMDIPIKAEAS